MKIDLSMLRALERERDIPFEELASIIEQAVHSAYLKHETNLGDTTVDAEHIRVNFDRKTGNITVFVAETNALGEVVGEAVVDTEEFGRIGANAAKYVIHQRLRDLDDTQVLGQFKGKEGQLVSGVVQQASNPRLVHIAVGDFEAIMPPEEQIPGEQYTHGTRLRVYVTHVAKTLRGAQITVSRTHPGLVRRLFELEVPELTTGMVEIVSLAREAGHRTKIAVQAHEPGINAKGACIGEMGRRVRAVMSELGDEKIDIVDYSPTLTTFVAHALSPAKVTETFMLNEELKHVRALVPDFQLSLAIGKEGQNARLAAKLTGAKIDVQPDSIMNE